MNKLKVVSPYDGKEISEVTLNQASDIDAALGKAHKLFLDSNSALKPHQRIEILKKLVTLMSNERDKLAQVIALEGGKPFTDAVVETDRAIQGVEIAISELRHLAGQEIPMGLTKSSENRLAFTMREPIGVVAAVSAFNHPLNLIVHQVIPAVAVGCPVLIKPASSTPLSCLRLVELLQEAGLPPGWCQAIICKGSIAEKMVVDKRVNFFSFIGSGAVGWALHSKLSPGTRAALEHGGVAPVIVEADADIPSLIGPLLKGGFYHAGQVCVSVKRIFVHESKAKEVAELLSEGAKRLIVGDPSDKKTEVGPLITHANADRVENWINEARSEGAEILSGGERMTKSLYAPTVIYNPTQSSKVSQQEIFGPAVCVYPYKDRKDAIKLANSLPFAFQASVFTKNIDTALECVKELNATAVMVNDHTAFRVDWMPFGGRDVSGLGMGGIPYSMHEMTRTKMMVLKSAAS